MDRRLAVLALLAAASCAQADHATHGGPRCFALDPGQAPNPAGTVSFTREDFSATGFVLDSIWDSGGRRGTTHLDFLVVGDHLESRETGAAITITLVGALPAPTSWTLHEHSGSYDFTEATTYDAHGYTMTSVDPTRDGPRSTKVHFHDIACADFDAALRAAD